MSTMTVASAAKAQQARRTRRLAKLALETLPVAFIGSASLNSRDGYLNEASDHRSSDEILLLR